MTSMHALLDRLIELDIRLWVDGELLRFSAPKELLTPELKSEIRSHKQALMGYIQKAGNSAGKNWPPLVHAERQQYQPLSKSQQRLWFLCRMDNDGKVYNMPMACRLDGPLDLDALRRSITLLPKRHEILRAAFPFRQGRPVLECTENTAWDLPMVDLSLMPMAEQTERVQELSAEILNREFDLSAGPLWRAALIKLDVNAHVLLMAFHHIILDLWSMGIYLRELILIYNAGIQGRAPELDRLDYQYVDFIRWQQHWVKGEEFKRQLNYWTQKLNRAPKTLNLATDFKRPVVHQYKGATEMFILDAKSTEELRRLSRQQGATLYMTLMAVYALFLSRYTGQKDIIIGSPIAGRHRHRASEAVMGLFVNMLALRIDLSGNPTFEQLLARVRQTSLEAHAHQDLPFEYVVDALSPDRDTSRPPLFQTTFVLQNTPTPRQQISTLTLSPIASERVTPGTIYDLSLVIQESGDRIIAGIEYNRLLYRPDTILRMRGQIEALIRQAVADPHRPISGLDILTDEEKQTLLLGWNNTRSDFGRLASGTALFESVVDQFSDIDAVRYGEETMTYRQLDRRANQLARYLIKSGVKPDSVVGLCVERSIDMIIGLVGIMKAGGAFLPIDPDNPAPRRAFMVEDAGIRIMVTQNQFASLFTTEQVKIVSLDTDRELFVKQSPERVPCQVSPRNMAYVIYTSGSTGKPKGAGLHHQGLINLAMAQKDIFEVKRGDRVLQFAFFSFDASVSEIFSTFCAGATLHLASPESLLPGPMLSQLIAEQSITHVTLPPSALTVMQPESLPGLKTLIVAGEACPIQLPRIWARYFRFINAYGPTETTVCAAAGVLKHDIDTVHIGRPIANTTVYLLDECLLQVPTGAIGEVYIGGTGVARGYINRPALTAERFIPDRFSQIAGSRLFKTGDMARYLPDGRIEFLGRRDYQVKIRGFRIELGEIEAALMSHPQLGPCVVGVEGDGEDKRLVAFCTSKQANDPSSETMRLFLEQRLPGYMIPSAFVYFERLPKTPSGKIDRNELLRMAKPVQNDTRQYIAPRDPFEEALAVIWSKILNRSPVSIHDNFFHCGGHSLKAVKLIDEVEKEFGPVRMASIFQAPTVAQFATILRQGRQRTEFPFIVELNSHGEEPPLYCVHPANGSIACYAELARLQNGKRKVYAFQAPELSSDSLLEDTVHSLAKMYSEGILASTAAEPYALCGFSLGGSIAFEMACSLEAAGKRPSALLLLDAPAPDFYRKYADPSLQFLAFAQELAHQHHIDLLSFLNKACRIESAGDPQALVRALNALSETRRWALLEQSIRKYGLLSDGNAQSEYLRREFQLFKSLICALNHYLPPAYNGSVTLFKARSGIQKRLDQPDLGWCRHIRGELNVVETSGDHYRMMEMPHIAEWMDHVDATTTLPFCEPTIK